MPLVRYFLWVGSMLLALLFIADACLPNLPAGKTTTDRPSPAIRIHSERKWPERIVFDTSAPMPRVATDASSVQGNPVQQTAAVIPDRARSAGSVADIRRRPDNGREPEEAGSEGAASTKNRQTTGCAARAPGRAAAAICLVWRPHVVVSTPKRIKCCWEAIRPRWQREPQSPVRRLPMRSIGFAHRREAALSDRWGCRGPTSPCYVPSI